MKTYHLLFLFLNFLIILLLVHSQSSDDVKLCRDKTTCSKCIKADPSCGWCKTTEFPSLLPRCDSVTNLLKGNRCPVEDIVNPEKVLKQPKNLPLSREGADPKDIIQIAPQEVNLKLRPGEPFTLPIQFRQAEDYPVDLYYLMDLSKSMEDDKDKLALLGDLLAEKMSAITKNFRLGFGSFVDKTVMPYVSTVPEKKLEPCPKCAAPYGFKNHMALNSTTDSFKEEVASARVSGNLDAPEGGFDAIMQAIVCKDKIGWREKSRKLLVFSTDSGFHYAGDGKLGGIVKPNDGNCHLDKEGYYTESTMQDYPSLSQLNQKAIQENVNMIFAVTANQVDVYERLSFHLEGATTGKLENDSSNVVDLIRDEYSKITSAVELKHDASPNVQLTFSSKCLFGNMRETSICKGLHLGSTVSFQTEIRIKSCPEDRKDWNQTITIRPVGINEMVVVNLEMLCECDCEKPEHQERDSPSCSEKGTYECGICSCYEKRLGKTCQCSPDGISPTAVNDSSCIDPNTNIECNKNGICNCGVCQCFIDPPKNFSGPYCECDNAHCNYHDGKMCSGKGSCSCGKCICDPDYTGESCECRLGVESCKARPEDKPCSGNGECVCGRCQCGTDSHGQPYTGPFCRECPTCPFHKCETYRPCVLCRIFQSGNYTAEQCEVSCTNPREMILVDEARAENDTERLCRFPDEKDDCKFMFVYGYYNDTNEPYIRVQRTKDCPPPLNILMIVLGVIGGIVAIGLCLLLLWKLLTTIHDRREFAKFEKERQMAKWDTGENPIFKGATTTFKNPTYGGK